MRKIFLISLCFFGVLSLPKAVFATHAISESEMLDAFSAQKILAVHQLIKNHVIKTPLVPIASLSEDTGKLVFLKDESRQLGLSFKTRGVTYEVFATTLDAIAHKPRLMRKGLQLVTQTDGNHGVALILAITAAIEKYSAEYPLRASYIKKIEPVIFTYSNILPRKRQTMQKALERYRQVVGDPTRGQIIDTYKDYADARSGREKFIAEQNGRAIYMEHGGIKTMQGHASATVEILDQLEELGISKEKRVCILLPIGAGGPIGLSAALKALRPGSYGVMVQTPRYGAFVESFKCGKLCYNDGSQSPYTVTVKDGENDKEVIYEDGISVDGPESEIALQMALKYLDDAILSDPKRALNEIAPLLLADCDTYYKKQNGSEGIVGGTTAIVGDALLANFDIESIQNADVIVLFGTEGSIDDAIANYTRALMNQ